MDSIDSFQAERRDHGKPLKTIVLRYWQNKRKAEDVLQALFKGEITVDGKKGKPKMLISTGQMIHWKPKNKKSSPKTPQVPVIFEDDDLIVIDKPAGLAVNGDRGTDLEYLVNKFTQAKDMKKVRAVHRIDVPTSGLVIMAKNRSTLVTMSDLFEKRKVHKTYLAHVHGLIAHSGLIHLPIEGKACQTSFERIQAKADSSQVKLHPITGRTHQLRIHLFQIGHPIIGDHHYYLGPKDNAPLQLSAHQVQFTHPGTGKRIYLTAPNHLLDF